MIKSKSYKLKMKQNNSTELSGLSFLIEPIRRIRKWGQNMKAWLLVIQATPRHQYFGGDLAFLESTLKPFILLVHFLHLLLRFNIPGWNIHYYWAKCADIRFSGWFFACPLVKTLEKVPTKGSPERVPAKGSRKGVPGKGSHISNKSLEWKKGP